MCAEICALPLKSIIILHIRGTFHEFHFLAQRSARFGRAAALQGLEQQDAYPRSLYAVGVTGSAEDETIAQSAAGAMVQSLSAHEARDGASSGVESLCGNRMRFTFRCRLRVPEDSAAAWGVTPDAAGEAELTRSCVLVRDAVGFWHPAAVENV